MSSPSQGIRSIFQNNRDVPALPFIFLGALLLIIGLVGVGLVLFQGHEHAYGVTREVPWGLLIATYAYFVITSTGLAFIGGLGHAFGFEKYAKMSKRIVLLAFIILLAGFTQIGMELGHPFRLMFYFLLSPNFDAPIVWMGLLYGLELIILAVELVVVFFPRRFDHKWSAVTGFLALVVGIAATSNLGFVFGSINARPFYHGLFFPVYLVVSGIVGGAALLLVINALAYKFRIPDSLHDSFRSLGRLMGLGLAGMAFLLFWKVTASLYTEPEGAVQAAQALLTGPMAGKFWIGEVILAIAVPLGLILLVRARNPRVLSWAGGIYLVGLFFTRYNFIVAGQMPPMRPGLEGSGVHTLNGLAHYTPATAEWMVFALGLGLFLFLYFLAERFINLQSAT